MLILAGCKVGPNYQRPSLDLPHQFRGEQVPATNSLGDLPWWQIFRDDDLQALLRSALTNNFDVRIAATRVEQARAIADIARAGWLPSLDYQAQASRGKNAVGGSPAPNPHTANFFAVAGTVSWEVDLWGRIRRLSEAAKAQFLASEEAERDVRVSLLSQAAQAYFQLLALDAQLAIARRATNAFADTLKIFSERLEHGVASRLETTAAQAALSSEAAAIPDLERQIALQEDLINVLLGRYTGPVPRNDALFESFALPAVPGGLPSGLLERRPDVREAEQSLRSANAQMGVAEANFFPRLDLTGLLGQASPELSTFTHAAPSAWSIAANLAGPIFHGGALRAQYRQAKAVRDQYLLQYEQTVVTAFREVSDALLARQYLADARLQQRQAVTSFEEAVQVVRQRYLLGQSSYFEVLQQQELLFPALDSLVQIQLNQYLAFIQLYRSLGGGFSSQAGNR